MSRTAIATLTLSALAAIAGANPVDGLYFDTMTCDMHGDRIAFEELGTGPLFPFDERIEAIDTFIQEPACPMEDDPTIPNRLVVMTNLTTTTWQDLFYVSDLETSFSNVDGLASTIEVPPPGFSLVTFAFRIDSVGMNRPLIFESIVADGLFQPGETWHFIVQDFTNSLGLPPSALGSLDFSGGSSGDPHSAASIVQFRVPAPGSAALILAAAGLSAARRRR